MLQSMIRTLRKAGYSLYSSRSAPCPIPKPNPNCSALPPLSSSNRTSPAQFTIVHHDSADPPRNYFYCSTEVFRRMLIEYKNDNKKIEPYVVEAAIARTRKHGEEDEKLMEELGFFQKGPPGEREYKDIYDMDPDEDRTPFRNCIDLGEWKEVRSPSGLPTWEKVGSYPPSPYGISGPMFSFNEIEYYSATPDEFYRQ